MSPYDADAVAGRYLRSAGTTSDRYELDVGELVWLVDHATRLRGLRLELLSALQSALPSSPTPPTSEEGVVPELKELLTDLIIMHSRLAGRDESLQELLGKLSEERPVGHAAVDEETLRSAVNGIVEAARHVQARAGDGP